MILKILSLNKIISDVFDIRIMDIFSTTNTKWLTTKLSHRVWIPKYFPNR